MVFNLKGKSALVTGASGGIGSAVARALHNQGAELIINGTRSTELEKLAAELGNKVHVLQGDLSVTASVIWQKKQRRSAIMGSIYSLITLVSREITCLLD